LLALQGLADANDWVLVHEPPDLVCIRMISTICWHRRGMIFLAVCSPRQSSIRSSRPMPNAR